MKLRPTDPALANSPYPETPFREMADRLIATDPAEVLALNVVVSMMLALKVREYATAGVPPKQLLGQISDAAKDTIREANYDMSMATADKFRANALMHLDRIIGTVPLPDYSELTPRHDA